MFSRMKFQVDTLYKKKISLCLSSSLICLSLCISLSFCVSSSLLFGSLFAFFFVSLSLSPSLIYAPVLSLCLCLFPYHSLSFDHLFLYYCNLISLSLSLKSIFVADYLFFRISEFPDKWMNFCLEIENFR